MQHIYSSFSQIRVNRILEDFFMEEQRRCAHRKCMRIWAVSQCRTYYCEQFYTRRNQQLKWRIFTIFTVKWEEIECSIFFFAPRLTTLTWILNIQSGKLDGCKLFQISEIVLTEELFTQEQRQGAHRKKWFKLFRYAASISASSDQIFYERS